MTEKAIMLVYGTPLEGTEAEWHQWYETIHIPDMLSVPGVRAAKRYRLEGNGAQQIGRDGQLTIAQFVTVYELEATSIETIRAAIAVEAPKWKEAGRSFAGNRVISNTVYKLL